MAVLIVVLLVAASVRLLDRDDGERVVSAGGSPSSSTTTSTTTAVPEAEADETTTTTILEEATTTSVASAAPATTAKPSAPAPTTAPSRAAPQAVRVATPDAGGVYVMRVDGSELTRVVTRDFVRRRAAISPDKRRIAYGYDRTLSLVEIDGNGSAKVAGLPCVPLLDGPRWSPDGSRLAVLTGRGDRTYQLFVAGGDGRGARQVSEVTDLTGFAWAPDGSDLVFISHHAVWRVRPDGSQLVKLVDRQGAYNTIRYSPDGSMIAFTTFDGLWVMGRDGSGLRRIGSNEEQVVGLAWSPDGREIAYRSGGLRIAGVDGGDRLLVEGGHAPRWSVRNRIVYVFADRNPTMPDRFRSNIEAIDPDGGNRARLVEDSRSQLGEDPELSADGEHIVFTSHSGGDSHCPTG